MKFEEVAKLYFGETNPDFKFLRPSSKLAYTIGFKYLGRFNGMDIKDISRPMIIQLRDDLFDHPGKCRRAILVLSCILRYAYDRGWVEYNHCHGLKGLPKKVGIRAWTEDEFALFTNTCSKNLRLAAYLALYTGQRRGDLVKMKWGDIEDGMIKVRQQKTETWVWIPIHKALQVELDKVKRKTKTILRNRYGDPWVADSLTAAFTRHASIIGIGGVSLHGLRKTAASALAEAGCTVHQIAAITGHRSLRMVEHYTKDAQQKKLAREAISIWRSPK